MVGDVLKTVAFNPVAGRASTAGDRSHIAKKEKERREGERERESAREERYLRCPAVQSQPRRRGPHSLPARTPQQLRLISRAEGHQGISEGKLQAEGVEMRCRTWRSSLCRLASLCPQSKRSGVGSF